MSHEPFYTPSETKHRVRHLAGGLIGTLLGALVVGLIVVMVQMYGVTRAIERQQDTNTETNEAILSCTDPEGECAKRGQQQTAEALVSIKVVNVIVAACADKAGEQTPAEIEKCVTDRLDTLSAKTSGS